MCATTYTRIMTTFSQFMLVFIFLLINFTSAQDHRNSDISSSEVVVNVGAIINADSRVGKEEIIAMEIALQDFNNNKYSLMLFSRNSGGDPLQASATGTLFFCFFLHFSVSK